MPARAPGNDQESRLEVMALRGRRRELRRLASRSLGLKGVLHGGLVPGSLDVLTEVTR